LQPVFLLPEGSEPSPVRALLHRIEVTADAEEGTLSIEAPFEEYGLPGDPVALRRLDSEATEYWGRASDQIDTRTLAVEDEHGNPVSNREITVAVVDAFRGGEECENPPVRSPLKAVVYERNACPVSHLFLDDCGARSASAPSASGGTAFGVIMGNDLVTGYTVKASAEGVPSLSFSYLPIYVEVGGHCIGDHEAVFFPPPKLTFEGKNQDAAHVGREAPRRVRPTLFYWVPEEEVRSSRSSRGSSTGCPTPVAAGRVRPVTSRSPSTTVGP